MPRGKRKIATANKGGPTNVKDALPSLSTSDQELMVSNEARSLSNQTAIVVPDPEHDQRPKKNNGKGPPHGGGVPAPRAEIVLRIRIIEGLMLRGFLGRDIQRALENKFRKKIPWTTVQKYIRHVARMWEEEDALARPYRRARQLRQLHDVADQLMEKQAWKEWLECQRLIARIEGNEAPQRHELETRSRFDGWTVEELEHYARTQEIPERLRAAGEGTDDGSVPAAGA